MGAPSPAAALTAPTTAANMVTTAVLLLVGALLAAPALGSDTSNYEKQAISINYVEHEGLPTQGVLNGTVTELDDISHKIALNKTQASLNCSSGFMDVAMTFREPFFGIVYADFDRNSACKITGNGQFQETIKLPLKGCGTLQRPARVFTNNIVVRFHPGLEIDGDEVITIVCRYPTPIVPVPAPILLEPAPPPAFTSSVLPLRELEVLLIICAIIFMALMLLGIGCSYYCLKKRNIKVVRRRPQSTLGSDITKASEPPSMFTGLKLPRVVPLPASGSEEMTESIKTDFPSDIASVESEEEYTSAYSDKMCVLPEGAVVHRLHDPPKPNFDVNMIVKDRAIVYTPDLTAAESSESETVLNAQEQYLTTILERTETNTLETLERIRAAKAKPGPPPVHARINIKSKTTVSDTSDVSDSEYSHGTEMFSEQEMELETRHMSNFALDSSNVKQGFDVRIKHHLQTDSAAAGYTSMSDSEASTTHDVIRPVIHHRSAGSYLEETTSRMDTQHLHHHQQHEQHQQSFSTSKHVQVRDKGLSNFDVLIRIVDQPTGFSAASIAAESASAREEVSSVFTEEEKLAIKEVILQDVSIQEELKSTFVRQNFLVLKDDRRISEAVQPQKWEVLIRILDAPAVDPNEDRRSSQTATSQGLSAAEGGYQTRSYSGVSGGDGAQQMSYSVMESSSHFASAGGIGVSGGDLGGLAALDTGSIGTRSHGARSAADRSAAEITEYHHYTTTAAAQSETVTSSQHHTATGGAFGWYEEEEEARK